MNQHRQPKSEYLTAVVASAHGEIFELEGYAAVGMSGRSLTPLTTDDTQEMPFGGELMYLPQRVPLLYDLSCGQVVAQAENPYAPEEPIYPVAAFNSPGYLNTHVCAFQERPGANALPLFAYGAVGWLRGGFRSAVVWVDREPRQDLRKMPRDGVLAGIRRMRRRMPENRLRAHLETCALTYGCPAGKNFFLGRYEAPLPTSRSCNARCLGCISLQSEGAVPCSQARIAFTPTPAEIEQVAMAHIGRVRRAVVSFGQGCEGDPLMAARVIEPAVRAIRARTDQGTINLNTNGSRPDILERLFDAGIESVRVSLNSVRPVPCEAYFRPQGYTFADVVAGIDLALRRGVHVAINYLNIPGFTDAPEEVAALLRFLEDHPIQMIQWRNLNFDPLRYWTAMDAAAEQGPGLGMKRLLGLIRERFPRVDHGYFNPPKEKFRPRTGAGGDHEMD